jgi:hypothetical protein
MEKRKIHKTSSNVLVAATWVALSLLPFSFLLSVDNLHCTQNTSFKIALFDMKSHIEGEPEPLIYKHPFAVPLRSYFGLCLLVFYFSPVVSGTLFIYDKISAKDYFGSFLYIAGFHVVNIFLSIYLAGERFTGLYINAGLYCTILYPMYIVAALGWRNKMQGFANSSGLAV